MVGSDNPTFKGEALGMLKKNLHHWLTREVEKPAHNILFDFNKVLADAELGDVWLIEGHSRISRVISVITRSPWTHAALYLGKPSEFLDESDCQILREHYSGSLNDPLVIESIIDRGVIVTPAHFYQTSHIRVCRPRGLIPEDAKKILHFAIGQLGDEYATAEIFDLMRFLYPWHILPRRWHSSLFRFGSGGAMKLTCSCLLADAFGSINFPILPAINQNEIGEEEFILRNPKLFTPRDFDYSPFSKL